MTDDLRLSFEFFPPRSPEQEALLWRTVDTLSAYRPDFVSVTYGAGGSTHEPTLTALERLVRDTDLAPAGHLTCVDATRDAVDETIRAYVKIGVRHVVALRGDPKAGVGTRYEPAPGGYQSVADLVGACRRLGIDEVSVSAYPEKHPESPTLDHDLDLLAEKADAGATRAITQFFFETDCFYRFRDAVAARGIDITLVPGILPIGNFQQARAFAEKCGTTVPDWLVDRFAAAGADTDLRRDVAVAVASEQVADLIANGVEDFHIYTMNRAVLVTRILAAIGITVPAPQSAAA